MDNQALIGTFGQPPRRFGVAGAILGVALAVALAACVLANPCWGNKTTSIPLASSGGGHRVLLEAAPKPQVDEDYVQLLTHLDIAKAGPEVVAR